MTEVDVAWYLANKSYGTLDPSADDVPTLCRLTTIKFNKKVSPTSCLASAWFESRYKRRGILQKAKLSTILSRGQEAQGMGNRD